MKLSTRGWLLSTVMGLFPSAVVVAAAAASSSPQSNGSGAIVKSLFINADVLVQQHDDLHRRLLNVVEDYDDVVSSSSQSSLGGGRSRGGISWASTTFLSSKRNRKLEEDEDDFDYVDDDQFPPANNNNDDDNNDDSQRQETCDASFIQCLPDAKCVDCFATLEMENIDWTGVTPETSCDNVVKFLVDGNHCQSLQTDDRSKALFCKAFESCVVWDDSNDDNANGNGNDSNDIPDPDWVNCTALTECQWESMHKNWIGDGVCHDNMHGCYNTAICGYDGGDCCPDTCHVTDLSSYTDCGHDGYACRDPSSSVCDATLSRACTGSGSSGGKNDKKDAVVCDVDETKYRLVMFDSFGDGWDATVLTIQPEGSDDVTFKGGLVDGFQGTEYVCLSRTAQCYNVKAEGGTWGVEVSWEIRPMGEGSPAIAGGGAPGDCDFSVAGDVCDKTCDGSKPNIDPTADPDYKSFKDLYTCIEDKCVIQLGSCNEDEACRNCFAEDAPDYCFGIDAFVAVIDCTMCSCTEKEETEYCTDKSPGQVIPVPAGEDNGPKECTPKETMTGANAIMEFSKCSDLDGLGILVSDFDQNNFGMLDQFEACAHSFRDEDNHGGHTALGCMKILQNAITNPTIEGKDDAPVEAISALAKNLYDHAENFCDCSKKASDACPLCPKFMNFKTLLYESLDACDSLDMIDCDSWSEFWKPCKDNLESTFGSSEFVDKDQCEYTKNDCGGAGAFPAFRRLDCEGEISDDAWNFYKKFGKKCLKGSDGVAPSDTPAPQPNNNPVPAPTKAPRPDSKPSAANKPTPKPYVPDGGGSKPYVPADDRGSSSSNSDASTSKKKSHWFRNLVIILALGGVGYYVYKKRNDGFNFVQYRRRVFGSRFGGGGFDYGMVNMGTGENEMYSNLNSSTTFEPPSLPPTPQMMGGPSMMQSMGQMGQQMMGTEMT